MAGDAKGELSWLQRIGLAIVHPRWALSIAGDRQNAGRSGSDLLLAIVVLLVATRLRAVIAAVWLGAAVEGALGARAFVNVLTRTLTVDLGFLVIGAVLLWSFAGKRRDLGRAFDLACVAALPLVYVDLLATTAVESFAFEVPVVVMWMISGIAYAWTGTLIAFAMPEARRAGGHGMSPPEATVRRARRAGVAVVLLAVVGAAIQLMSVARHVELVRPMTKGSPAPMFALPAIGPRGELGPKIALAPGKITILDFWATWCGPCLAAMPRLDALARSHRDVVVLAVNLDDPAAARALFDEKQYAMTLVADDNLTSERYGVSTIPHTVLIDGTGIVRLVARGNAAELEKHLTELSPPHP
ncbi:MAG: alkyl hydroperoxide reductase/Thiol specific antioxidant/Mal allergen [Myxococcales bacterium]|nr:alkyl hydroperoxide reductase/Thiol specific antioxidant/Mal allergen [Myxococcales bacterium]